MTSERGALRAWIDDWIAGWDRFWFTPADPATLGLIRILAGAMLLYTHLVWGLALTDFFGDHGWLSREAVQAARGPYSWSYLWWIHSTTVLWIAHVAALIVLALLTLGLYSRLMSVLAFIITASYVGRAQGALFGLDHINLMLSMYLMLGPSGAAYSLDRLVRRPPGAADRPARPSVAANIAIRLIQIHLCIIYLCAGTAKLTGPAWWDGTAMWKAVASLEYQSLDMTWMAHWPLVLNLLTHVTIFWELFYCALIWPRATRPVMLALAVPLHLGIAFCLGMITFGLVMLIANLAFVPPHVVRALLQRKPGLGAASAELAARPAADTPAGRTARAGARSAKQLIAGTAGNGPLLRDRLAAGVSLHQRLERTQRGIVVRLVADVLNRLGVDHLAVLVEHERAPGQDLQFFDQHAPILAEGAVEIIAGRAEMGDLLGSAEPIHRKGQIHADRECVDLAAERAELFVELLGLHLADRRVERRHDADDRRLALQIGRLDRLQAPVLEGSQCKVRSRLAGRDGIARQSHGIAFEADSAGS